MTLKVEGTVVAEWVAVLERECVDHLDECRRVELDFGDVTFVDREGVAMLRRLDASGVMVLHATALVQDLLWGSDAG